MAEFPISAPQRKQLIQYLSRYVETVADRQEFLANAGLRHVMRSRIQLEGKSLHFAAALVDECQDIGTLPSTSEPALASVLVELKDVASGHESIIAFIDDLLAPKTASSSVALLTNAELRRTYAVVRELRRVGQWSEALKNLLQLRSQDYDPLGDLDALIENTQTHYEKIARREEMTFAYSFVAEEMRDGTPQEARQAFEAFLRKYPKFDPHSDLPSDYLYPPTPEQQTLLDVMLDIRIPPPQRAEAGRELSKIGDPRRGVGVLPNGIPDIVWCEVRGKDKGGSPTPIGGDDKAYQSLPAQTVDLDTFWIAKYPITFQQYQAFIDDKGYDNPKWWEGLQKQGPYEQYFKFANHPRENITWTEMVAFSRWLSVKTDLKIRLPLEEEWEKAARGEQGSYFPWGNDYESGRANIDETETKVGPNYLGTTTAVGLYPHGASPYGAMDMSGNVWEATLSAWDKSEKIVQKNAFALYNIQAARVWRGGSWLNGLQVSRVASRYDFLLYGRVNDVGARVVCASAPHRSAL